MEYISHNMATTAGVHSTIIYRWNMNALLFKPFLFTKMQKHLRSKLTPQGNRN